MCEHHSRQIVDNMRAIKCHAKIQKSHWDHDSAVQTLAWLTHFFIVQNFQFEKWKRGRRGLKYCFPFSILEMLFE